MLFLAEWWILEGKGVILFCILTLLIYMNRKLDSCRSSSSSNIREANSFQGLGSSNHFEGKNLWFIM